MNIVVVADKKNEKLFRDCLVSGGHNLIGYETEIRADFVRHIAEDYNPHILVAVNGVKSRRINLADSFRDLKAECPKIRIVYLFGQIGDKKLYADTARSFSSYGIYDVVPYDMSDKDFSEKFSELIRQPMTAERLQELIGEKQNKEEKLPAKIINTKAERIIDTTYVDLSRDRVENNDYNRTVITVDELSERLDTDNVTVAVGTITERQMGCTVLIAFEIAAMLKKQKETVALFLDGETYNNYIEYHGIDNAPAGCEINGLTIYPIEMYPEKNHTVHFSVCDFGLTQIQYDCALYSEYKAADIKICLCSFNEWDISILANYLNNSSLSYVKEINYLFFPVSEKVFIKFSKQMIKGHCKANRLEISPDYTEPCEYNETVYRQIFSKYINFEPKKKRFGLFGRG